MSPSLAATSPEKIDAHQHFWRLSRQDYGWLQSDVPALEPLRRDHEPQDLHPLLLQHGVARTVVVQAADTPAETDHLLALAHAHRWIAGVVGWVALDQPGASIELQARAQHPKFRGVRPMLQDLPDPNWLERAVAPNTLEAVADFGLCLDALVGLPQLPALCRVVAQHPALPVVIDHAAKPQLAAGWDEAWALDWRGRIAELAAHPQVMCKFSGLLTEAARQPDLSQALALVRPVWDAVLAWFGPQRLIWGSDWPVLHLAADYGRWVAVCEHLIGELSPSEQALVWGGNAQRFYNLTPGYREGVAPLLP